MEKRGQVVVFVVLGIVVLTAVLLLFYFKDSVVKTVRSTPVHSAEYLSTQLEDLKHELTTCVNKETKDAAGLLILHGGDYQREYDYIRYINVSYPILCRSFKDKKGCLSTPLLLSTLEKKLDLYLVPKIKNCINFEAYRNKDYTLTSGELNLSTTILDETILVTIGMPITLTKGTDSVKSTTSVSKVNVPLGSLVFAVDYLLDKKASEQEIDLISFTLLHKNKYRLRVHKPYPDEVYDLSLSDSPEYHFYFAIEGEGRYPRAEGKLV